MTVGNSRIGFIGVVALCASAAILTAMSVRTMLSQVRRMPTEPEQHVPDPKAFNPPGSHELTKHPGQVGIIVFNDYECSTCKSLDQRLTALITAHPNWVNISVHHLPLDVHSYARPAAEATECADAVGRFRELHSLLLEQQDSIGTKSWARFALGAGVQDTSSFGSCVRSHAYASRVDADVALANRLNMTVTPIIIVDDEVYSGIPWDFERIVARHVEKFNGPARP